MALIKHHTRGADGAFSCSEREFPSPAEFVVACIPDGVPFRCYRGNIEISKDIDAMLLDADATVIEFPGGGVGKMLFSPFSKLNDILGINRKLWDKITPKAPDAPGRNAQATSANNSLTDRTNKPRPYQRVYDICGTVQSIPSDMMQSYRRFDANNKEFEFGYYYVGRGHLDTPSSGITDGDTLLSAITGSSANIYDPFTSPNNSAPRQVIGETITEPLFIGSRSNEIDGITLKAPNELGSKLANGAIVTFTGAGAVGTVTDNSGDANFDDNFKIGDQVTLLNVSSGEAVLDGNYTISTLAPTEITFNVASNISQWSRIAGGSAPINGDKGAIVNPADIVEAGFTDWVSIRKIKPTRVLANFVATLGLNRDSGSGPKSTSVIVELQWQPVDETGAAYGPITTVPQTITDKTRDECGMSIIALCGTSSAIRVRARRSSNKDLTFNGTITDEIKFRDLYGQIEDTTPHYGDMTTIHTQRKATVQATAAREPQLKVIATEMIFKYLGGGVFDTVRTPNTQAVQSLIRMMRDPLVGGLTLSADCMDKLLAVQADIEGYFQNVKAGQFCYTFDDGNATAQDIAETIASAVFCTIFREGNEIRLHFDKPSTGPAMVFTHRSKAAGEKWSRSFASDRFDSVELTYIDPVTNIRETIKIPEEGGVKPNKIDTKGVRNYQQAYWAAHRARQRDILQRVSVEFTAMPEGIYVVQGQPISVVKGSRVSSYDGYIVAQSGLTLTLSQEVEFTDGDDHYIILKRRDGSAESIKVDPGVNARTVNMLSSPVEPIYTGNSALKTEFSFGNEARHMAQMIVPATVDPQTNGTVKITGKNYHPDIYLFDGVSLGGAFSNAFSNAFDI